MQYDVRFLKKYFIYIGTCYESFRDHDQCKAFETLKSLFKNNMRLIRLKFILITYTNLDVILSNKLFYDMFFFYWMNAFDRCKLLNEIKAYIHAAILVVRC